MAAVSRLEPLEVENHLCAGIGYGNSDWLLISNTSNQVNASYDITSANRVRLNCFSLNDIVEAILVVGGVLVPFPGKSPLCIRFH